MKLSICIVSYESAGELEDCLSSIKRCAPGFEYEVIVVDNNSQDGSAEIVSRLFPDTWLIQNSTNRGFGRAANQAIRQARGGYILLLNPDTRVGQRSLDNLVLIAEHTVNLGTLGASLVYPDGKEQPSSYKYFPGIISELRKLLFMEKLSEKKARRGPLTRVAWSCGAALLFKRELKGELVLLDPNIFLYSEDIELAWRLRRAGYNNYVTALSKIEHAHNKSGEKLYGDKASAGRLGAFKDTLFYVTQNYYRGPGKKIRFRIFAKLVALNSYWRQLVIPLIMQLREQPLTVAQKMRRLAQHKMTAKIFGQSKIERRGLWTRSDHR